MNRSGAAAGVMQSSPVQQMMMATGNPTSWWNLNYSHPLKPPPPAPPAAVSSAYPSQNFSSSSGYSPDLLVPTTSVVANMNNCNLNLLFQHQNYSSSSSSTSSSSSPTASSNWSHLDPSPTQQQQHLPTAVDLWSQFLANGTTTGQLLSVGTDNRHHHDKATGGLLNQQFEESNYSTNYQKMENIPVLMQQQHQAVKQDNIINPISNYQGGGGGGGYHNFYGMMSTNNNTTAQPENNNRLMMNVIKSNHQNWPRCSHPFAANSTSTAVASPQSSCVTTNFTGGSNLVDFPHPTTQMAVNTSPECKNISAAANTGSGGGAVLKKAKVQQSASSSPSTFKVRKFGDRITALHQMVSPFGKTDTASVLLEAIGYIRFLHSQIEALSIPYLSNGNGSANNTRQLHPHNVQGDQKNCLFPEDPGQISNDNCLKRKAACHEQEEPRKDLRSTGLCLVPLSCTALHMGNENGADYWAPSLGGFR